MCQPQEKKKEISVAKLRYRFELPMIIIGFVLLFLALGLVALLILSDLPIPDWLLIVLIAPIAPVIAFLPFVICTWILLLTEWKLQKISYQKFIPCILIWQKKWALALKIKDTTSLFNQREWCLKRFCGKMLFTQTLCCHSQ